ncbi:hypothetical protein DESC_180067 [Desulfosarcina cetonica]|nr:hypothetical protein DESC_180067 [Desulfosarcina cetonica]
MPLFKSEALMDRHDMRKRSPIPARTYGLLLPYEGYVNVSASRSDPPVPISIGGSPCSALVTITIPAIRK